MVDSTQSGTPANIKILSGREGYPTWKFKMRAYLIDQGLWFAIKGYPEDDKTDASKRVRNDQKALAKICLCLDDAAITHVRKCDTALDAWTALSNVYEDKGYGRKLRLQTTLYQTKLSDYNTIEEYITQILNVTQQLADIGKEIPDDDIAAIMLGGLPSHYAPLVMALENSNVQVTTELVKAKLLNEMAKTQNNAENALISKASKNFNSNKRNKYKKVSKQEDVVCYGCKQPGHKRPDCPKNKKTLEKQDKPQDKQDKKNYCLLTALGANSVSDHLQNTSWFVDSGATNHMSFVQDQLSNLKSNKSNLEITVANNNKLYSKGSGDVENIFSCEDNDSSVSIKDVIYVPDLNANLLSVSKCTEKGFIIVFCEDGAMFLHKNDCTVTGEILLKAIPYKGVYKLKSNNNKISST